MKHFTYIITLIIFCSTTHAQPSGQGYPCSTLPYYLNCYTTVWYDTVDVSENLDMFRTDTINGTDLWVYGNSSKPSFSNELGFVTDSINSYPVNAKGILEYHMPRYYSDILLFEHKFNTDTLTDGGYVRVSCDQGQSWYIAGTNEMNNTNCSSGGVWYVNYPNFPETWAPSTIQDTIPAFTGNGDWAWSAIQFAEIAIFQENLNSKTAVGDSIYFQFVFESDTIDSGKDGWMIRRIVNATADVIAGVNDNDPSEELTYYPNPTTDRIQVKLGATVNDVTINAYNALGELVQTETQNIIDILDYTMPKSKGVYLIQLVYSDGKVRNLKVVKE